MNTASIGLTLHDMLVLRMEGLDCRTHDRPGRETSMVEVKTVIRQFPAKGFIPLAI